MKTPQLYVRFLVTLIFSPLIFLIIWGRNLIAFIIIQVFYIPFLIWHFVQWLNEKPSEINATINKSLKFVRELFLEPFIYCQDFIFQHTRLKDRRIKEDLFWNSLKK